jgi:chorismate mutase
MAVRGVRGAVIATSDSPEAILSSTRELLLEILAANPTLQPEDIASVFFTVTPDLHAAHPAQAARGLGWVEVPLMCAQEIPVPNGLPRCIRILLHWNTPLSQHEIQHIYLGEAASLRPDLRPEALESPYTRRLSYDARNACQCHPETD